MIKKIGVLLIALSMITIVCMLLHNISTKIKIRKEINDFYGDDIEIVSIEYNFKLSEKGHSHYDVLAKKRNSGIYFSINPDTMLNTYTCDYWNSWMKKQATLLIKNNFSEKAYCSKIMLYGKSLLNNPNQKIMDYNEYMNNCVEFDTEIVYKIPDNFSDVEVNVEDFFYVLDNSDLIFDKVSLYFGDGVKLYYSYEDKSVIKIDKEG